MGRCRWRTPSQAEREEEATAAESSAASSRREEAVAVDVHALEDAAPSVARSIGHMRSMMDSFYREVGRETFDDSSKGEQAAACLDALATVHDASDCDTVSSGCLQAGLGV